MACAEVFPVQASAGTLQLDGLDELIDEAQVVSPSQAALVQAGVERIGQQAGPIGAHIEGDRQHPLRVEPCAEGVDGQLALADVDSSHPLISDAEDPL